MITERGDDRHSCHLEEELKNMEIETDLFEMLLRSYPDRLNAVRISNDGHIMYIKFPT